MKIKYIFQLYLAHQAGTVEHVFGLQHREKSLFRYSLENLLNFAQPGDIALFVPENLKTDPEIQELSLLHNLEIIDVLPGQITRRVVDYIVKQNVDAVVRIIANNPFVNASLVRDGLAMLETEAACYLTYNDAPVGFTPSEIISVSCLRKWHRNSKFTRYLADNKDTFILSLLRRMTGIKRVSLDAGLKEYCQLDLSIKNAHDFEELKHHLGGPVDPALVSDVRTSHIIMAHIEPTNHCNLDCVMCPRTTRKSFGNMSFDNFKRILDKMIHLRRINLNGDGEPFLNPQLPDMLAYSRQKGVMTRVITNATVKLPLPRLEKLLFNLDFFNISLDGASTQTFQAIRRNADFQETIANIMTMTRLIRDKRLYFSEFWVNTVIQQENRHEIVNLVRLMEKIGIPAINFKLMNTNYDRGGNQLDEANQRVKERMEKHFFHQPQYIEDMIAEARDVGENIGVQVHFERDIDPDFSYQTCALEKKIFITFDGYVTPCCLRTQPTVFNFGNILEEDYQTIFASQKYRTFIKSLLNGKPQLICKRCPSMETLHRH